MDLDEAGLAALSDERLGDEIVTWSGRLAAGEARLLVLVAEFDRREAWGVLGLLSCAHWLARRMGLRPGAPPPRPTSRPGSSCAATARPGSSSASSGACGRVRRAEEDAADPEAAAHWLRTTTRYDDDGTLVLTVRLPAERGAVLLAGIEQARADLDRQRGRNAAVAKQDDEDTQDTEDPEVRSTPAPERTDVSAETSARAAAATTAEGLLEMARACWSAPHGSPQRRTGRPIPRALPPRRVRTPRRPRALRRPSHALRDLLGVVDGERCRFPSCTRHRWLQAHHVRQWSDGGSTDLANLVLLCSRHHVLVHRDRFALVLHADRGLEVATADGTAVPHLPPLAWRPAAELDPDGSVSAETLRRRRSTGSTWATR